MRGRFQFKRPDDRHSGAAIPAQSPTLKNAEVTSMESLRYKEFCYLFSDLPVPELHRLSRSDAFLMHELDSTLHMPNTKIGSTQNYVDRCSWKGTRRDCRR